MAIATARATPITAMMTPSVDNCKTLSQSMCVHVTYHCTHLVVYLLPVSPAVGIPCMADMVSKCLQD